MPGCPLFSPKLVTQRVLSEWMSAGGPSARVFTSAFSLSPLNSPEIAAAVPLVNLPQETWRQRWDLNPDLWLPCQCSQPQRKEEGRAHGAFKPCSSEHQTVFSRGSCFLQGAMLKLNIPKWTNLQLFYSLLPSLESKARTDELLPGIQRVECQLLRIAGC